jgi:type IV secretory pathway VirB10-like protein
MNRPIVMCALLLMTAAGLGAQNASQSSPYEGTSTPPPDDSISTTTSPLAKPPAGQPAATAPKQPRTGARSQAQQPSQTASARPAANRTDPDGGIVQVEQSALVPERPALTARSTAADPDGDIVHPEQLRPGELGEGTTIRVELLDMLSTTSSERGQAFRCRVATDVLQGGQVLIPAGAEIDGRVAEVSSGHPGGRGSMRLQPETVILPNGSRYTLHADVTGTPGSRTRVRGEGTILPASRLKRDGIEYGGAVGTGLITGAVVAGPVGALTGGLIGAGAVTAHLLISHPQATLEPGTVLLFSLAEPLLLAPVSASGN